ncbi:MAG TPA: DUF6758 family protein [Streptosporangiaceae bacterium]|nr:DUF6758 family protein [Streptosporangiaceae bacterium]
MKAPPTCPRCGGPVTAPSAWASGWRCQLHGEVYPLWPAYRPAPDGLRGLLRDAKVPVWLPWPLPASWLVTGFAGAGDDRSGTHACVVALSGPSPVGGLGELLLVSEEIGVGLGARLAGLAGPDPGEGFAAGQPHATVRYRHHEFPLWHVDAPDRAAFAGEALGTWLWVLLWPDTAGVLLVEAMPLRDLRDPDQDLDLPFGAASPRLPG